MAALVIISDASQFLLMGFCLETAWLGGHFYEQFSQVVTSALPYIDYCHI
ncbi:hypothetical protein EV13_1307 [Prochlorococcus sp. MIT 0702]|nr:hypothetical protein EV13_1307 [Prochlorococcus sp. MIT 0702]